MNIKKIIMVGMAMVAGAVLFATEPVASSISFGDTYWLMESTWSQLNKRDLAQITTAQSISPLKEIALFEVVGPKSKDEILPVVENLGFAGTLSASVLTDEELLQRVMPPLSTTNEWGVDNSWIDLRSANDFSGPGENYWETFNFQEKFMYYCETDSVDREWPYDMWPDNKSVANRFWVAVECTPSTVGRWYGLDGSIRVWQSGTNIKSEPVYVAYSGEWTLPFTTDATGLFRGITINTKFSLLGADVWNVEQVSYNTPLHAYWLESLPREGSPLSLTLPEAGILYLASVWFPNIEGIKANNADGQSSRDFSYANSDVWQMYNDMGGENFFYEYGTHPYGWPGYLAVEVNSARSITLEKDDEDECFDFNRLQFFPKSSKAVAIEASYLTVFDRSRYQRYRNGVGEYFQGYVTGTGVYKVGETVAVTAVPAPGEAFDHWELKYGNFPSGIDTTNPTLSFVVTDACAGTAEERKQMVVKAVWKEKHQMVATSSDITKGHATGSGFYHTGDSVTLTAVPETGYEFVEWSDGVKTASRTVTATSVDQQFCANFVVTGSPAEPSGISLGDPYCYVDPDKTVNGYANLCNGSSWIDCWADSEDWAVVPINGADAGAELTPVIVYGSADASMISNVHIEDEATFKARIDSAGYMEWEVETTNLTDPNDITSFVASRKWLMAKINSKSGWFAPKTFFMGLKGGSEYRKFIIVQEDSDGANEDGYDENSETIVLPLPVGSATVSNNGAGARTVTVTPNAGMKVSGWSDDGSNTSAARSLQPRKEPYFVNLASAGGEPPAVKFTVMFDLNGAEGAAPAARQIAEGAAVGTLPEPTRTGYSFKGWFTAADGGEQIAAETVVSGDVTYYAQWTINQYTVAFDLNGADGVAPAAKQVTEGSAVGDLPTPTRTGHTFAGWWTAADGGAQVTTATLVSGDVTYYAHWTINQYTVTFDANGGTGGTSGKQDYGSAIVAPTTVTREGYTFTGWSPAVAATVPASNVTYTAQWTVNQYTVTFDANGGTGGTSEEQDYGSAIVAPTVKSEGHTFAGWTPEVAATVPASNVTYTARWTMNKYTVTFDANGGTGETSGMQDYGSAIVPPMVTREGHTFAGWLPAVVATVPASNVMYTAQWTVNQYTVTFDANGGNGGTSGKQDYGSAIVPPTVKLEGYTFMGWSPEVAATVPASNVTYVAQWSETALPSGGVAWYVNGAAGSDSNDGASEESAKATIQAAIDEAKDGDTILVAPGAYRPIHTGGKWIAIRSTDGANMTFIDGGNTSRCATLADNNADWDDGETLDGSTLVGFTLVNGYADGGDGGGIFGGVAVNCIIHDCRAHYISKDTGLEDAGGGGAICAMLYNCLIYDNRAKYGAGASDSVLYNCTVVDNVDLDGNATSQVAYSQAKNTIIGAVANESMDTENSTYDNCLLPDSFQDDAPDGCAKGNIRFADAANGDYRILHGSDAMNSGNDSLVQLLNRECGDILGGERIAYGAVDIGCYEYGTTKYTVTFDANGGTLAEADATRSVAEGAAINAFPEPTFSGYTIDGWWTAAVGGTQVLASTIVTNDMTCYAHWTTNQYTVTFDANGGNGGMNGKQDYGSPIVPPTVTREGHVFAGWLPEVAATVPASNVTYTAQWTPIMYSAKDYAGIYDGAEHGIELAISSPSDAYAEYCGTEDGVYSIEPLALRNAGTTNVYYHIVLGAETIASGVNAISISAKSITDAMVGQISGGPFVEGEGPFEPAISVADGALLTADDYEVEYANNVSRGTATVTVTGRNNYQGMVTRTFQVLGNMDGHVRAEPVEIRWDGAAHVASIDVGDVVGGTVYYRLDETSAWSHTVPQFTEMGEYTVYYKVAANGYADYAGSTTVTIISQYDWYADGNGIVFKVDPIPTGRITIPETYWGTNLTGLAMGLFNGCRDIVSVEVPACIKSFGDEVFANCVNLKSVTFLGDCPYPCGENIYSNSTGVITYVTPDSTESWGGDDGDATVLPRTWNDRPIVYIGGTIPKEFDVTASSYYGYKDGFKHGITVKVVNPPAGIQIWYSIDGGTYTRELPMFTNECNVVVYWRVKAEGYFSASGEATVTIKAQVSSAEMTSNKDAPVEFGWLEAHMGVAPGSDREVYETAAVTKTGKWAFGRELTAYDEYVMLTDPTKPGDVFALEMYTETIAGKTYNRLRPKPDGRNQHRKYTYYFKENLADEWKVVTEDEMNDLVNPDSDGAKAVKARLRSASGEHPEHQSFGSSGFFKADVDLDDVIKAAARKAQLDVKGGDLDGDNQLSKDDMRRLLAIAKDIYFYEFGWGGHPASYYSEADRLAADVTGDGVVDYMDVVRLSELINAE